MGKGNYLFRDSERRNVNTYYIEVEEEHEETFLEYFRDNLKEICDKLKLELLNDRCISAPFNNWESIYVETGIYELRVADNEWSVAIACVPKIMEHNSRYNPMFSKSANKIMKEIHKIYKLRPRAGAWTSGTILDKDYKEFY